MIRPLIGIVAALLGLCLLAGVAVGEQVTAVPTSVTFSNPKSGVYEGEVKSSRAICRKDRRVAIIDDRNHNGRSDHSDPTLAKVLSGNDGAYTAKGGQPARGERLLIVVGAKILSRTAFCRPFVKNATALSG